MNIVAKTTYGKFVMICHGKFRDLSGVAVMKCKKASEKISANFNLANQVQETFYVVARRVHAYLMQTFNCENVTSWNGLNFEIMDNNTCIFLASQP